MIFFKKKKSAPTPVPKKKQPIPKKKEEKAPEKSAPYEAMPYEDGRLLTAEGYRRRMLKMKKG